MKQKLLLSVLMSIGILVGGFGLAYAFGTFHAIQQGFRQSGEGQAARITMQVEAGTPDGTSTLLPDNSNCGAQSPCPGGALEFTITNTSDFPIRVTAIAQTQVPCGLTTCGQQFSNKNEDGSYGYSVSSPTCANHVFFQAPGSFTNWPTIAPHSTLNVNGTDANQLGVGMIHLDHLTPDGCEGALFGVGLTVTATESIGQVNGGGQPLP